MKVDTIFFIEDIKNNWLTENKPKLKVCLKCQHCWLPLKENTRYCPKCRNKYGSINKYKWKKYREGKKN